MSECDCWFHNHHAYFCIQGEAAAYPRLEVREQGHNFQLVVVSGDDWCQIYILFYDISDESDLSIVVPVASNALVF